MILINDLERFFSKYDMIPDGCWLWKNKKEGRRYVTFWDGKKQVYAHRFSYRFFRGEIPPGADVCHSCDTPHCVNPDHLFIGTRMDNMRDAAKKGRINGFKKGQRPHNEKLTPEVVMAIRADTRTHSEMAAAYKICEASVYNVRSRRTWAHV